MGKYTLRIGFINFYNPTLLIIGELASLNWFAECIEIRQSIDFSAISFAKQENINLLLEPTESTGILTREDKKFFWNISLLESQKFSMQLRELATSQKPAHTYLDPTVNKANVEVVASKDEYDDLVFA
jgi:hypothetical protein